MTVLKNKAISTLILSFFVATAALFSQNSFLYKFETQANAPLDSMKDAKVFYDFKTAKDSNSIVLPMPFAFIVEQVNYPTLRVYGSGFASFNPQRRAYFSDTFPQQQAIFPSYAGPNIVPFTMLGNRTICRQVVRGVSPNRIMIVDWRILEVDSSLTDTSHAQVWLYEKTNNIEIRYGQAFRANMTGRLGFVGLRVNNGVRLNTFFINTITHNYLNTDSSSVFGWPGLGRLYRFIAPEKLKLDLGISGGERLVDCNINKPTYKLKISNFGADTANLEAINAQIIGRKYPNLNPSGILKLKGLLASGASQDVEWVDTAILANTYAYYFTFSLQAKGDEYNGNDSIAVGLQDELVIPLIKLPYVYVYQGFTTSTWWQDYGRNPTFSSNKFGFWSSYPGPNNQFYSGFSFNDTTPRWLISTKFTANALSNIRFKGAISGDNPQFKGKDSVAIMVSTDCGISWKSLSSIHAGNADSLKNKFQKFSVPLRNYAGQSIMVALRTKPDTGRTQFSNFTNFVFDSLIVSNGLLKDLTLMQSDILSAPTCQNDSLRISFKMKNTGEKDLLFKDDPLKVHIVQYNYPKNDTLFSVSLNKGGLKTSDTLTFNIDTLFTTQFATNSFYNILVSIDLPDDYSSSNNTVSPSRLSLKNNYLAPLPLNLIYTNFSEYNQSETLPKGWNVTNTDVFEPILDLNRFSNYIPVDTFADVRNRRVPVLGGNRGLSGWIVSPLVVVDSAFIARFRLAGRVGSGGLFRVLISSDCGTNWEALTETNTAKGLSSTKFVEYTYPLSKYTGKRVYIAFGIATTNPENFVFLDDVFIGKSSTEDIALDAIDASAIDCLPGNKSISIRLKNVGSQDLDLAVQKPVVQFIRKYQALSPFNFTYPVLDTLFRPLNQGRIKKDSVLIIKLDSIPFESNRTYEVSTLILMKSDSRNYNNGGVRLQNLIFQAVKTIPLSKTRFSNADLNDGWKFAQVAFDSVTSLTIPSGYGAAFKTPLLGKVSKGDVLAFSYRSKSYYATDNTYDYKSNMVIKINEKCDTAKYTFVKKLSTIDNRTYQRYTIPLDSLALEGKLFSFAITHTLDESTINPNLEIDDIYVGQPNTCSAIAEVRMVQIGTKNAIVEMSCPDFNCNDGYILEYGVPPFAVGKDTAAGSSKSQVLFVKGTFQLSGLEPFTPYEIYVRRVCGNGFGSNSAPLRFQTAPINDESAQAINLTVTDSNTPCDNPLVATHKNATYSQNDSYCRGYNAPDVWFKFVANAFDVKVSCKRVNTTINSDYYVAIYDERLSLIECLYSVYANENKSTTTNSLVPGKTYLLKISPNSIFNNDTLQSFTICLNMPKAVVKNAVETCNTVFKPINQYYNANEWRHIFDNEGGRVASLQYLDYNDSVYVKQYRHNDSLIRRDANNTPYLDRSYAFTPSTYLRTKTVLMRLYFSETDFNRLKDAENGDLDPSQLMATATRLDDCSNRLNYAAVDTFKNTKAYCNSGICYMEFITRGVMSYYIHKNKGSNLLQPIVSSLDNISPQLEITNISPNPTSGILTLTLQAIENNTLQIQVVDALGSIVKKQTTAISQGFNTISLNVEDLPAGIYHLNIVGNQFRGAKRFVKN
jgi:Secretion system C-terminal sorting domain